MTFFNRKARQELEGKKLSDLGGLRGRENLVNYVFDLQTTLASELGGAMAIPRQLVDVSFILVGFAHRVPRRLDKHCEGEGRCERLYSQRFHDLLHDSADL